MIAAIVQAIARSAFVTITYTKPNGILNVRVISPYAVERCQNGNTIVRAVCAHSGEPRSFTLDRIGDAAEGDILAGATSVALI